MSSSPPVRRLSTGSVGTMRHQEELINAYEAEEERIINVLSRKLEQLREDKIDLENTLEAESESHVNKLQRELAVLKGAFEQLQIQMQQQQNSNGTKTTTAIPSTSIKPRDINSTLAKNSNNGAASPPPSAGLSFRSFMSHSLGLTNPADPSAETMLEAMRRENEQLRGRLVDTERDYIRISRLNDIYREELIDYRRRMGVSVDNLIGLSNSDPFNQPTHHRHSSSSSGYSYHSGSSSPSTSMYHIPRHSLSNSHVQPFGSYNPSLSSQAHSHPHHSHSHSQSHSHGVPIPRPPSQIHRPKNIPLSESNTPLSHSPSSASASGDSPFPFSPSSANPASFVSVSTNMTSPPSSGGVGVHGMGMVPSRSLALTYPSVPPPSLSSSFGSPSVPFYVNGNPRDVPLSPIEPLSRRNSASSYHGYGAGGGGGGRRVAETGSLRSAAGSRRASFDRGARVAETGSLLGGPGSLGSAGGGGPSGTGSGGRSRAGSHSHGHTYTFPETVDEAEDLDLNQGMELGEEGDPKGVDSATKSR